MGAQHVAAPAERSIRPAGRKLQAGSGLVPDVVLAEDTLTTPESLFAQSLGGQIPAFRDVLTGYALELKKARPRRRRASSR